MEVEHFCWFFFVFFKCEMASGKLKIASSYFEMDIIETFSFKTWNGFVTIVAFSYWKLVYSLREMPSHDLMQQIIFRVTINESKWFNSSRHGLLELLKAHKCFIMIANDENSKTNPSTGADKILSTNYWVGSNWIINFIHHFRLTNHHHAFVLILHTLLVVATSTLRPINFRIMHNHHNGWLAGVHV